jgi:hypothetical protein
MTECTTCGAVPCTCGFLIPDQALLKPVKLRWSFSQWETYNSCPAKWKFGSVMKLPRQPPGPAASRGLEVHASVEKYVVTGDAGDLHGAISARYIPVFNELRDHENGDMHLEKKLGFDVDWAISAPSSKVTACIAILDAVRFRDDGTVQVYEWKSGKPKDTHGDQRKLYALSSFIHWKATKAEVTTYYLEDTEVPQKLSIAASGAEKLKALWDQRIAMMLRDEFCAPKPSYQCNWCDFSKKRGGPCRFGS